MVSTANSPTKPLSSNNNNNNKTKVVIHNPNMAGWQMP
jgi:hypothetical protein